MTEEDKRHKRLEYNKKYYLEHKEEISIQKKEYYKNNRAKRLDYNSKYYLNHTDDKSEYNKKYQKTHKKERAEGRKKNRDKINEQQRGFYKKYRKKILKKNKENSQRLKIRYDASKRAARKRKIDFNLTFEQFIKAISDPCIYCNNFLGKKSITGVGLDRVDNLKGYEPDNVVSCCKVCNTIKGARFSAQEAVVMIDAVLKFKGIVK